MNTSNQTLIGVKVKPLVWHSKNQWHYYTYPEPGSTSNSQPMQYIIKHYNSDNGLWDLYGPGHWGPGNKFPNLEAAQAAAQVDYEARIFAALEVAPGPDLAEAGKVLGRTVWVVFNNAPIMGGAPAYVTWDDPRPLPLDQCEAVEFARADTIRALITQSETNALAKVRQHARIEGMRSAMESCYHKDDYDVIAAMIAQEVAKSE